jgi:hypothetical protein
MSKSCVSSKYGKIQAWIEYVLAVAVVSTGHDGGNMPRVPELFR